MDYIDIIMPVYNCEKYVQEAIESVKKQTYQNWRLIIIEDASNDNTLGKIQEIIKDIKEKVFLIKNTKNKGVAVSRNLGIEKSTNKYIAFLDSDDIWEAEKLEKQIKFMNENKYAFTYTLYKYLKNGKEKTVKIFPKSLSYKQALKNTFILTSTVMINTEKIDRKLIEMPKLESEDTATWWKILKDGNIAYGLKENLLTYRITPNGLSSNKIKNLKRTWNLYRRQENLNIIHSIYYFINYMLNAITKRMV